jgi:futalosine hydrolase
MPTGVGMIATAAETARALARSPYDVALNFGVCGSFERSLVAGTVVHVVEDHVPELGAEDGEAFLTLQDLALPGVDTMRNAAPPSSAPLAALPRVRAITVNTVHGNARTIEAVMRRLSPQVESMEGAAFMHACLISGVPFAQVRSVSNVVERRNRAAWDMAGAIRGIGAAALEIIDGL